jgi:hypothetical protein
VNAAPTRRGAAAPLAYTAAGGQPPPPRFRWGYRLRICWSVLRGRWHYIDPYLVPRQPLEPGRGVPLSEWGKHQVPQRHVRR